MVHHQACKRRENQREHRARHVHERNCRRRVAWLGTHRQDEDGAERQGVADANEDRFDCRQPCWWLQSDQPQGYGGHDRGPGAEDPPRDATGEQRTTNRPKDRSDCEQHEADGAGHKRRGIAVDEVRDDPRTHDQARAERGGVDHREAPERPRADHRTEVIERTAGGGPRLVVVLRPQSRGEQRDACRNHEAPTPRCPRRLQTSADDQREPEPERRRTAEDTGEERTAETSRALESTNEDRAGADADDHARQPDHPEHRANCAEQIGCGHKQEGVPHQLEWPEPLCRHCGRQLRQRVGHQEQCRQQSDGAECHAERALELSGDRTDQREVPANPERDYDDTRHQRPRRAGGCDGMRQG